MRELLERFALETLARQGVKDRDALIALADEVSNAVAAENLPVDPARVGQRALSNGGSGRPGECQRGERSDQPAHPFVEAAFRVHTYSIILIKSRAIDNRMVGYEGETDT